MICPKCGFRQPDDLYCANCGVDVQKFLRTKKRRRYRVGIVTALLAVVSFIGIRYMESIRGTEKLELA